MPKSASPEEKKMSEALYIAEDGEIKLFKADTRYVIEPSLELPPGESEFIWRHDSLTGLNLPEINTSERRYERLEPITVRWEKGIRRLEERDRLEKELEEADAVAGLYLNQR
jgi:hypothetical protein